MNLITCGINHKTAPLTLREKLTVVPEKQPDFLESLSKDLSCNDAVYLATCNRCEVYAITPSQQALIEWLCDFHQIKPTEFEPHIYIHQDEMAISHAIKVSTGMDSMVFGEPQIFGQMKAAVSLAKNSGTLGADLDTIFQQIFAVVKKVRAQTTIGNETTSVASVAVNLAKLIFEDFSRINIMIIGAGETTQQVIKQFSQLNVNHIYAFNRHVNKAKELVLNYNGSAFGLDSIPEYLAVCDIIVSATAAEHHIIDSTLLNKTLLKKRHRPKYFIDLALPRDIEPNIANIDGIYLYDLDDLQKIITNNLSRRKTAALNAEKIIQAELDVCLQKLKLKQHHHLIQQFRDTANSIKAQELEKALGLLNAGENPEIVINKLATTLTGKLTHEPTLWLKKLLKRLSE